MTENIYPAWYLFLSMMTTLMQLRLKLGKNDNIKSCVLDFSTESGNQYIYDDCSGMIFPNEPSIVKRLTDTEYCEINREAPPVPSEISVNEIKTYISENGYNQLTLEMTADCNFRCKFPNPIITYSSTECKRKLNNGATKRSPTIKLSYE